MTNKNAYILSNVIWYVLVCTAARRGHGKPIHDDSPLPKKRRHSMSISRSGFVSDVTDTPSLMTSIEETHPEQKKRKISMEKINESGQSGNGKVRRKLFSSPGIAGNQSEVTKVVCTVARHISLSDSERLQISYRCAHSVHFTIQSTLLIQCIHFIYCTHCNPHCIFPF